MSYFLDALMPGWRQARVFAWFGLAPGLLLASWGALAVELPDETPGQEARSGYAGSDACRSCHQQAFTAWQGSHHQKAMQTADAGAVLAEAAPALADAGTARLTQADGVYRLRAQGPDGRLASYPVAWVFGVEPLQQYLLPLPRGRLQASNHAWDTERSRWFDLYPEASDDPEHLLHWSRPAHTWNFMCADCHATAVRKNYNPSSRSYRTRFAEVSVGCEACHGPAAAHAQAPATTPAPASLSGQASEINACAPCHSRRAQLAEGFHANREFLDHYAPALLEPGLYHPDGQILDEVYEYGSFLQSRMHAAGVTCSNCHEPHAARLRLSGNQVCTQCHNAEGRADFPTLRPARYDRPAHHLHVPGSAGAECVNCHMPARAYMQVDDRRDHSFRIPRPDLAAQFGAPHACAGCHQERSPEWAADVLQAAFGKPQTEHFVSVFAVAEDGKLAAEAGLAALAEDAAKPPLVRASALARLAAYGQPTGDAALVRGLNDAHPLVRLGAVRGLSRWPVPVRWRRAQHLLSDEFLALRHAAAPLLAPAWTQLPASARAPLAEAIAEYRATQRLHADRPEAAVNRGNLHLALGEVESAELAFREALALAPQWTPALVNLADLYRASERDALGGPLLQRAVAGAPDSADAWLALGFWRVRQGQQAEAVALFERAASLAPARAWLQVIQALALQSAGRSEAGLTVLDAALDRLGEHPELLRAAASMARALGSPTRAAAYESRLQSGSRK